MALTVSELQQLVAAIVEEPEPVVIGAGAGLHHEIAAIRYEGARQVCAGFLTAAREQHGNESVEHHRLALGPIRKQLTTRFPEYAERLADPGWPESRTH